MSLPFMNFLSVMRLYRQTEKAVSFLEGYIEKHPFSKAAWFNLGTAYSNLELYEKAIDAYDYCIAIDESFASAYFNKANCYANLNNYPAAVETYLETTFHENPEPLTFFITLPSAMKRWKNMNQQSNIIPSLLTLIPILRMHGWVQVLTYDALNNPKVALTYIEQAIKLAPTVADYWFLKGDIQLKMAQIEEGILSYRKVIELEPDDPEIWLELSMVYAEQKNFARALETLQEGSKYHNQNPDFLYASSIYLLKSGKTRHAYEVFEKALTLNYDGHRKIFKAFPDLRENQTITDIIEGYRDKSQ